LPTINVDKLKGALEKAVFKELRACQKQLNFEIEYETESLPYTLTREYIPDFIIKKDSGRKIYIETKGYLRPDDRAKLLSAREFNPEADIRIVFQQDNKLNKNSRTRYSQWAERHGFKYAIGTVPREWLSE
jgi:hypothetical protein